MLKEENRMVKRLDSQDVENHKKELYALMQMDYISTYGFEIEQQLVESKINALPEYIDSDRAIVYGVFNESRLSSFIWAYPIMNPNGRVLHVAYIAVSETDRNKGVGSKLIAAIEQDAKKMGIKSVELIVGSNNYIARSFYIKNHYKEDRLILKKTI